MSSGLAACSAPTAASTACRSTRPACCASPSPPPRPPHAQRSRHRVDALSQSLGQAHVSDAEQGAGGASTGGSDLQQSIRVSDVVDEPLSVLSPITGVMRAAQLSLIEAAVVTNLPDMNVHGFAATEFAGSVPDNPHGLQVDEMAAITLYTMESELYQPTPFFPF